MRIGLPIVTHSEDKREGVGALAGGRCGRLGDRGHRSMGLRPPASWLGERVFGRIFECMERSRLVGLGGAESVEHCGPVAPERSCHFPYRLEECAALPLTSPPWSPISFLTRTAA